MAATVMFAVDHLRAGRRDPAAIEIRGRRLVADPSGALVWPEHGLLVVADLHFEKASAFARRGQLIPPYDTRSTLDLLEALIGRVQPRRVISLGDGFHDLAGPGRLGCAERARLQAMVARQEWIWVLGNHDPAPPTDLGGTGETAVEIGGLQFRHTPDGCRGKGEVAGHLHPVARLQRRGRSVRRACFIGDAQRVILPAFGALTGGLDIQSDVVRRLFEAPPALWLIGRGAVHRIPADRLDG